MHVVEWDSTRIGGWITYHGPFEDDEAAESWIEDQSKDIGETELSSFDLSSFETEVELRLVHPEQVATSDQMYRYRPV